MSNKEPTSEYPGVYKIKGRSIWRASIHYKRQTLHLGQFTSEIEAVKAYNQADREKKEGKKLSRIKYLERAARARQRMKEIRNGQSGYNGLQLGTVLEMRSPDKWAGIIKRRIVSNGLRMWLANIIMHHYPRGEGYFTELDKMGEDYDSRFNTMTSKELRFGFEKLGLPYHYSPHDDAPPSDIKKGFA